MPKLSLGHWKKSHKRKDGTENEGGSTPTASPDAQSPLADPPQPAAPIKVPRDYFACPTKDLIVLVGSMISELTALNDALPFDPESLTRFHSRSVPGIAVQDYLVRIVKFCSLEKSILLAMVVYVDLLCRNYPKFNVNSLTVHRYMITSAMIGSKGLCDSFCTNSHYAKVGGVSREELNLLEVEFLSRVDYRIVPRVQVIDQYYQRMVARLQGQYEFSDEPEPVREPVPEPDQTNYIPVLTTNNTNASPVTASPSSIIFSPRMNPPGPGSDGHRTPFILPSDVQDQQRRASVLKRASSSATDVDAPADQPVPHLNSPKRTRHDVRKSDNGV